MNYKQLDALNGIMCMAEAAGWSLSGLGGSGKEKKTPLPHLNESHNKDRKSKGCPAFLLPNSWERDGKRGSKPVKKDSNYLAFITPIRLIVRNFKIYFSFPINKPSVICQFLDILLSHAFLVMHVPWKQESLFELTCLYSY